MKMGEHFTANNVFLTAALAVFSCMIIHFIYKILFAMMYNRIVDDDQSEQSDSSEEPVSQEVVVDPRPNAKGRKRMQWKPKPDFTHPWLLKNLKGHPGTVLHIDFSANGKFLAAACDETIATVDSTSTAASRRRVRRPPAAPPTPPSSQGISTEELIAALRPHLLTPERMWALGYPLEIEPHSSKAVMYINPPRSRFATTSWDVNAPEFVPGGSQGDSGRGSWGSTPRSDSSDEEADSVQHSCIRCDKMFRVTRDGEYVIDENCVHHWGRTSADGRYTCCNSLYGTKGCSNARFHVWNGTRPGMNGPFDGYVRARSPRGGVYAIDAEMCYTTAGLELTSIAVIAADGRIVYRSLVKPSSYVVDHNTRFSGIRPRDLARATKTLKDVQNDILGFVGTDTILIGHALDNDLRALKLLHSSVIDTCDLYPHPRGFPLRRSLRDLSQELLGRSVQKGNNGHSPLEDARAAMDLVLLKVQRDRAKRTRANFVAPVLQPYDPLVSAS